MTTIPIDSQPTAGSDAVDEPVAMVSRLRAVAAALPPIGRSERPARCIHCLAESPWCWGNGRRGSRRWRCRACTRTVSTTTGTAFARCHAPDKLRPLLADMQAPVPSSCRRLAALLGVDRMTVWRWRKHIMTLMADHPLRPVEAMSFDGSTLRESRKASREWVDHRRAPHRHPPPDRLRWIDYLVRRLPLPRPMTPYRVAVGLVVDADRHHRVIVGNAESLFGPPQSRCSAGPRAVARSPNCDSRSRPTSDDGWQTTSLVVDFELFLRLFRGPATKHLAGYAAWFSHRRDLVEMGAA